MTERESKRKGNENVYAMEVHRAKEDFRRELKERKREADTEKEERHATSRIKQATYGVSLNSFYLIY